MLRRGCFWEKSVFRVLFAAVPAFFSIAMSGESLSEDLKLADGRRWAAVASSKDMATAIGIARLYREGNPRVVRAKNGWFAAVLGPVEAASIEAYRETYRDWPALPQDALLSEGDNYDTTVWRPPQPVTSVEFDDARPAAMSGDGLDVEISRQTVDDMQSLRIKGTNGGRSVFDLTTPGEAYSGIPSTAMLLRLDRTAQYPQIVVTQNTGGAHCCTQTWIVSALSSGEWKAMSAGLLDGGGYWPEDVDGDGAQEMLSVDNTFLYAFDSYAASFAPLRLSRLIGSRLEDVTADAKWNGRLLQDVAGMEFLAKLDSSLYSSNGFLAAWVAQKIRLGQGKQAWQKMLKSYDRTSDFGPQECLVDVSLENCPPEQLRPVPFPQALAEHLRTNGYVPVPE